MPRCAVNTAWKVRLTPQAVRDLQGIQRHLANSYIHFGEDVRGAVARAERRVRVMRHLANRLVSGPHRGTRHGHLLPGLRSVTIDQLAIWFNIDEDAGVVRVLALSFGGQDQHARMLARLPPPQG